VALIVAIVLAIFVLPSPWSLIAVIGAAIYEGITTLGAMWWSQRRSVRVGAETLIGREAVVRQACRPLGQVGIRGEIWQARCDAGADRGVSVRVAAIDGLTLVVEPVPMPLAAEPEDPAAP
jgi:membrane-bound serine protease (ClpP class)